MYIAIYKLASNYPSDTLCHRVELLPVILHRDFTFPTTMNLFVQEGSNPINLARLDHPVILADRVSLRRRIGTQYSDEQRQFLQLAQSLRNCLVAHVTLNVNIKDILPVRTL